MQQVHRYQRTRTRAHPESSVHQQVHRAANLARNQLIHSRIDRRILPADAHAGKEPKYRKGPEAPGERACHRRQRVGRQRHQEQLSSPQPVRKVAEEQRTQHRPNKIGRRRARHLRISQSKTRPALQDA